MQLARYFGYFRQLKGIIGFKAAVSFSLSHLWNKVRPPKGGRFATVPVGPYVFYFPYLPHFVGLVTEIFFKESYYLEPTQEAISVIDGGANIGVALLYVKLRAPNARVTCFEPNPAARAVLEKNIEKNHWKGTVTVHPVALGMQKGTAKFYVTQDVATSSDGSMSDYLEQKGRTLTSYDVPVEPLSGYIDRDIDLLKVDIEGPEFDVLQEMAAHGKLSSVKNVQLEYHYVPDHFTTPLSDVLKLLEANGFKTFVQANGPAHAVIGKDTLHTYMVFAWRP